jgi:hypothetical protein
MRRIYIVIIGFLLASCSGGVYPGVTPTVQPATFAPTMQIPPTVISTQGTPMTFTPTPTRTPTATRTPTVSAPTSTPRPPTITPVGTVRVRTTPNLTPDCGNYDCMGPGLPNFPILHSPTPIGSNPTSAPNEPTDFPTVTIPPQTLLVQDITPIVINGTAVNGDVLFTPIAGEDLDESDGLTDLVTPVFDGGLDGDSFGNGGNGLGFGDGGNAIGFGNFSINDRIWIAYAKGLFDDGVNLWGPFAPIIALLTTYIGIQFLLIVANLFIPVIAIVLGILRKVASTIADFTPF